MSVCFNASVSSQPFSWVPIRGSPRVRKDPAASLLVSGRAGGRLLWKTDQLFVEKSRRKSYVENASIADLSALGTAIANPQPPRGLHSTVLSSWQSTVGKPDHACTARSRELMNLKAVPDCGSRAGTQPRGELRSDRSLSKFGCNRERD